MSSNLNNDDIKRFINSLDKAIKASYTIEPEVEVEKIRFPKIFLGESRDFLETEKSKPYNRPFITILLERRESATLTDTKFFSGMKQHGAITKSIDVYAENEFSFFRKDNEITLIIRAKSKNEIYETIQAIEKIFFFGELKALLDCEIAIYVSSKEKRDVELDFFVAEVKLHVRTVVTKKTIDTVTFDKVVIKYGSLCRYYDLSTQKCTYSQIHGTKAEQEDDADDIKCYNRNCKDYLKN